MKTMVDHQTEDLQRYLLVLKYEDRCLKYLKTQVVLFPHQMKSVSESGSKLGECLIRLIHGEILISVGFGIGVISVIED